MRLDEVCRLKNERVFELMLYASLLGGTLARRLTVAIDELERLASEAASP
jgi:hypothetical protein